MLQKGLKQRSPSVAFAPVASAFPVPTQPSESGTRPSRAWHVCLSESSSRKCQHHWGLRTTALKDHMNGIGFSELQVTHTWVSKVSVLDLPAQSSLCQDSLTLFSRGHRGPVPPGGPGALVCSDTLLPQSTHSSHTGQTCHRPGICRHLLDQL